MKFLLSLLVLLFASCSFPHGNGPAPPAPTRKYLATSDGKRLSVRSWNTQSQPETVVIALHGIAGAARDFGRLGRALRSQSPRTALYALNMRGLGYDSVASQRGDIESRHLWLRDLKEFHHTLASQFPEARFIWLGESMGGLIAQHAVAAAGPVPDGLVLTSPVTSLKSAARWQRIALALTSNILPKARVSLEDLAGGDFAATADTSHFAQSERNPYYISRFTLRFLEALAQMAHQMSAKARETAIPVLILQGGRDFLSPPADGKEFAKQFQGPVRHRIYANSRHLLFYDEEKEKVVAEILNWIRSNPAS